MFQYNFQPSLQMMNPPFTVIGMSPSEGQPGRIGIQFQIPTLPALLSVTMIFDRNEMEDLLIKLREAIDTAKGLKKL